MLKEAPTATPELERERNTRTPFEQIAGRFLARTDTPGVTTYTAIDDAARMAVTVLTEERVIAARQRRDILSDQSNPYRPMGACWLVTVAETTAPTTHSQERVVNALNQFDLADEAEFWGWGAADLAHRGLETAIVALINEHVIHAVHIPDLCDADDADRLHNHGLVWITPGAEATTTADDALTVVEHALTDADAAAARDGATRLWVWLDEDIDERFITSQPGDDHRHLETTLPHRPPHLPKSIQEMWLVHRGNRRGWHWHDGSWSGVVVPS